MSVSAKATRGRVEDDDDEEEEVPRETETRMAEMATVDGRKSTKQISGRTGRKRYGGQRGREHDGVQ